MRRILTGMQVTATFLGTSLMFFWPFLFGFMEWDVESGAGAPSLSEEPVAMLGVPFVWRAEEMQQEFEEKGDSEPGPHEVKPKPQETPLWQARRSHPRKGHRRGLALPKGRSWLEPQKGGLSR